MVSFLTHFLIDPFKAGIADKASSGLPSLVVYYTPCARGHFGAVVTHSPPTSEVGSSNPGPYVGRLVVS